jgi:hypothetical protein
MPAQQVISDGANPELLWLRNSVLKGAGFDVATAEKHVDALTTIQRGDCGTRLMCYSLALPIRQLLAEAFRKHCPDGRIIAITNSPIERADFADDYVYGVEGPEALIKVVKGAHQEQG